MARHQRRGAAAAGTTPGPGTEGGALERWESEGGAVPETGTRPKVSLGRRPPRAEGLVAILRDCHDRIRAFTVLAATIAERADASETEVRDACARCQRYFAQALPLHVADEEESILPRLRGKDPPLDRALDAMREEHELHQALFAQLFDELDRVASDPADASARRRLRDVAARLRTEFDTHLRDEERRIFPRIDSLVTQAEQSAILEELRARRRDGT